MGNPITRDTSRGQLAILTFGQDAVAASQTDTDLPRPSAEEGGIVSSYIMPWQYDVVGVAFKLSAAASAGTLTIGVTKGGTEDTDTTLTVTTSAGTYKRVPRGACSGVAGDAIGAQITTDSNWNATTADLGVEVYVIVYLEGV